MKVKSRFDHHNYNVKNLEASLDFYEKSLGMKEIRRKEAEDGSFLLVFLGDEQTDFLIELTWLRDWDRPYNLGDNETHLCVKVHGDYNKIYEFHKENDWVVYENKNMGLYFISDPDGYWIEVLSIDAVKLKF